MHRDSCTVARHWSYPRPSWIHGSEVAMRLAAQSRSALSPAERETETETSVTKPVAEGGAGHGAGRDGARARASRQEIRKNGLPLVEPGSSP